MPPLRVAIVGASGETGGSVVNGLLESSTEYEITALTRPASLSKSTNIELQGRGVKLVAANLDGPQDELVKILTGIDTVVVSLEPSSFKSQIPLANAAKAAGVKRFVPCCFGPATPVGGILTLRDIKEDIINHIKSIYLPYTIIDVGWWFQLFIPAVPSGHADAAIGVPINTIVVAGGSKPLALTDLRDVGRYAALIINDPRTINKMVFAYGETRTQKEAIELMERLSDEKIETTEITENFVRSSLERMKPFTWSVELSALQYMLTWGIRGDNTPENARYLGYMDAKELYPDFEPQTLESFYTDVLTGKITKAYKDDPSKSTTTTKIVTKMVLKTIARFVGLGNFV